MVLWKDSWGFKLVFDAGIDISDAIKMEIHYRKPNGDTGIWQAELDDSTSIFYVVCAGDLNQQGLWQFQVNITAPSWSIPGDIVYIVVTARV